MTDTVTVAVATPEDAPTLARILGDAFLPDKVSAWIFPDERERRALHATFFRVFVDAILADGLVHTTTDRAGVTLWVDVDPARPADPADSAHVYAYLREHVGDGPAERYRILDEVTTAGHPHQHAHGYLPFIAVAPGAQRRGVGSALLRHRLAQLDATGTPAYLEASSPRSAQLYERLGFQALPKTLDLPGGPSLYPMWRPATG